MVTNAGNPPVKIKKPAQKPAKPAKDAEKK